MNVSSKHWVFFAAAAVTGIFFVDWCGVVFQCGCRSLWNGIATYCNIHAASGPHCPWCEHPVLGGGIAFGAAIAAQWFAVYKTATSAPKRLVVALLAFPLASGLIAFVQRFVWSYWLD